MCNCNIIICNFQGVKELLQTCKKLQKGQESDRKYLDTIVKKLETLRDIDMVEQFEEKYKQTADKKLLKEIPIVNNWEDHSEELLVTKQKTLTYE